MFNFSLSIFKHQKDQEKIQVQYEDDEGKEINRDFEGMFSRIYQHEYDHTLGITFVEKVSKLKFDMAKKKAEKMYKRDLQRVEISQDRLDNLKKLV